MGNLSINCVNLHGDNIAYTLFTELIDSAEEGKTRWIKLVVDSRQFQKLPRFVIALTAYGLFEMFLKLIGYLANFIHVARFGSPRQKQRITLPTREEVQMEVEDGLECGGFAGLK